MRLSWQRLPASSCTTQPRAAGGLGSLRAGRSGMAAAVNIDRPNAAATGCVEKWRARSRTRTSPSCSPPPGPPLTIRSAHCPGTPSQQPTLPRQCQSPPSLAAPTPVPVSTTTETRANHENGIAIGLAPPSCCAGRFFPVPERQRQPLDEARAGSGMHAPSVPARAVSCSPGGWTRRVAGWIRGSERGIRW